MQREQIYTCMAIDGLRWGQRVYATKDLVDLIQRHGGKGRIGLGETVWSFGEWEPVPEERELHGKMLSIGDNEILEACDSAPVEFSGSVVPDRPEPRFAVVPGLKTPMHLRAVKVTQSEEIARRVAMTTGGEFLKVLDIDALMAQQRIQLARENADKVFLDPEDARPLQIEEINPDFDPQTFQRRMTGEPREYGPGEEPF